MPADRLWTVAETADYLQVPTSTLYRWSYAGRGGPPPIRVGRRLRYDPADVARYLARRKGRRP